MCSSDLENCDNEQAFYEELLEMSRKKGISVDRILQMYTQKKKEDEKIDDYSPTQNDPNYD